MFEGKAGAYQNEIPFKCFTQVGSGLTQTRKACQGQTLYLSTKIRKLRTKKFYNIGPWRDVCGAAEGLAGQDVDDVELESMK
jgi:hypothetical protein